MFIVEKTNQVENLVTSQNTKENLYCILIDGLMPLEVDENKNFSFLLSHITKVIYVTHRIEEDGFIIIKGTYKGIKICHLKLILEEIAGCLGDGQFTISKIKN
jgi:hypothetical protein